jgi:hypothetical protein
MALCGSCTGSLGSKVKGVARSLSLVKRRSSCKSRSLRAVYAEAEDVLAYGVSI